MERRAFIAAVTCGLLAAPLAAEAQQPEKVWRIGHLDPTGERVYTDVLLSLRAGLREFGYVESKNIFFEYTRHYTLEPFSKLDVYENPGNIFFEGPSRLIDDDTGATVGVAVTESMDVRIMKNAPYAANQH